MSKSRRDKSLSRLIHFRKLRVSPSCAKSKAVSEILALNCGKAQTGSLASMTSIR
jgi:hypothetical protein